METTSLTVRDNRTGREYELEIRDGSVRALDLRQIKVDDGDFGLITYDPGFSNTGSCRSTITYIDGHKGILRYRGYPIEELAGRVSFLEGAYLVFHGDLPDADSYREWSHAIRSHSGIPEEIQKLISSFPRDAAPMAMVMSAVAALSGLYPEASNLDDAQGRRLHLLRLLGHMPGIAACACRHTMGLPFVEPDPEADFAADFLRTVFHQGDGSEVNPVYSRALDVLFLLHADHEQNCSANAMRSVGSSLPDPYMAAAASIGALAGPLHGGANAAVVRMLESIGSPDRVDGHVERVKKGEMRLMGFGHRVYDPRANRSSTIREPRSSKSWQIRSSRWPSPLRCSTWHSTWSRSPSRTIISSVASSIPTWISIPGSFTKRSASPRPCFRCCSPLPEPAAGSRSGKSL